MHDHEIRYHVMTFFGRNQRSVQRAEKKVVCFVHVVNVALVPNL